MFRTKVRARAIVISGIISVLGSPVSTSAQSWKEALKTQLEQAIVPAKVSSDYTRITKPGTTLVVKKDGIGAGLGSDKLILKNTVKEGQVEQAHGLLVTMASKKTNRDYKVGEKVYATGFDVNDNNIQLSLVSVETDQVAVNGNTQQSRYKTVLQFDFPKDSLAAFDFARVQSVIKNVLQIGEDAETKTVEVGQSPAEVESAMGKPESILKVGAKTIYVYKSIKVTFIDGKVSDIQ